MKSVMRGAVVAAAALIIGGSRAHAIDSQAGTAASNLLTTQDSARSAAMGGAYTAVSDDFGAVFRNPAGLGYLTKTEFQAQRMSGFQGFGDDEIGLALPIGDDVTASNVRSLGTIAVNVGILDYGRTDAFDPAGNPLPSYSAKDRVLTGGWGRAFDRVAIGAVAKFYSLDIAGAKANGTLADAGILVKAVPGYLTLGAAVSNLGGSIQYDQSSQNATSIRGGAALTPVGDRVVLSADVEKPKDTGAVIRTGAEVKVSPVLALRAGYNSSFDAGSGLTFGIGLVLRDIEVRFFPIDRVTLDYSFEPTNDLDYVHRIALGFRVGSQ